MTKVHLKIKNITRSPYGARTLSGVRTVPPGQVIEDDFDSGEADNIKANAAVFEVGDNVVAETSRGANGSAQRIAALERQLAEVTAERDALATKLAEFVKPTLAQAVASLDDKNDGHWIDSGKPDLKAIADLIGAAVTRAEVDALDPPRVRATS